MEMSTHELRPCPACNGRAAMKASGVTLREFVSCLDPDCHLWGPSDDPRGEKWNALPRPEDVTAARVAGLVNGLREALSLAQEDRGAHWSIKDIRARIAELEGGGT